MFLFATTWRPALQSTYSMGTAGFSPGINWPGRVANHSPSSSAEIKNAWSYTSTSTYVFMAWYLVKYRIRLRIMGGG